MKRYLCLSLLTVLLLAAAVGGFNLWVDPYAIYRFETADAQRISRIDQIFTMRLSKPWQVARLKPSAVVIGSSRSATIQPLHPQWRDRKSFNLSMAGLTLYEMQRTLQHAHARGPLEKLVIGLEHETFIADDYRTGIGFAEGRLPGPGPELVQPEFLAQIVRDLRDTLFTGFVSTRSLQAWLGPAQTARLYHPDGSWENRSRVWQGESGYVFVGSMLARRSTQPEGTALADNLATFAAILHFCHRNAIDTRLYISPEHLFLTDLRRHLGVAPSWQAFHRELVALNEAVAAEHGREPFPLWGFNQLAGIVDEPLRLDSEASDAWFRDGIHFGTKLGVVLMDQMWGSPDRAGRLLDHGSLPAYFGEIETMRAEFSRTQSAQVSRYREKILARLPAGQAAQVAPPPASCEPTHRTRACAAQRIS